MNLKKYTLELPYFIFLFSIVYHIKTKPYSLFL